jgi:hypothetical protein
MARVASETNLERSVAGDGLAAGNGSLVLGVLTIWAAADESFAESLQLNDRVGPLSGKTVFSVPRLPRRVGRPGTLGILGTFPTFLQSWGLRTRRPRFQ